MKLKDLLVAVREKNLTKTQLEDYHSDLTNMYAQIHLELADIEKAEALYFLSDKKESDIATKRAWRASEKGQRQIELSHYAKATEKMLSSLKNRIYSLL